MTILEEIVVFKKLDIARRKIEVSVSDLENNPLFKSPVLSLKKVLQAGTTTGIIAEFKRKSPSKGIINEKADVLEVTQAYARHGAAGLSILTDEKFFGGSAGDLMKAREIDIPILQKDFIIDEYQVIEAKSIGANVILLIAACLTVPEVKWLASFAKRLGLEVLLEVHDESELGHLSDEVDMVGINNRDLKTFKVDIDRSLRLAEKIPSNKVKIAESGIHSTKTIAQFKASGFQGFLIGEYFMKEEDPGKAFEKFVKKMK